MSTPAHPWERVPQPYLPRGTRDFRAYGCYVASVPHYWVGRNAWYGNRSNLYPDDLAFATDFEPLVERIERTRTQGSQFFIRELPALVVSGRTSSLVLVEPSSPLPFAYSPAGEPPPKTLFALAAWALRNSLGYAIWKTSAPPEPAEPPFRLFKSIANGADFFLEWTDLEQPLDVRSTYELAARLSDHLRSKS